jgi:hypothetical protein
MAPASVAAWNLFIGRLRMFLNFYPTVRAAIG